MGTPLLLFAASALAADGPPVDRTVAGEVVLVNVPERVSIAPGGTYELRIESLQARLKGPDHLVLAPPKSGDTPRGNVCFDVAAITAAAVAESAVEHSTPPGRRVELHLAAAPGAPEDGPLACIQLDDVRASLHPTESVHLSPGVPSDAFGLAFAVDGLPRGATFDPQQRVLRWTPGSRDVGEHTVNIAVSNATSRDDQVMQLRVEEEWESFVMPGVGGVVYSPRGLGRTYQGASVEYLVYSFIHLTDDPGPSHGRFYVDIELMQSDPDDRILATLAGVNLSLERLPHRRWLVPYFGLEAGPLSRTGAASRFVALPVGGVWLWTSPALAIGAAASEVIPVLAFDREADYLGWRVRGTLDFAIW